MKTYRPMEIKKMSDKEVRKAYADLRPVMRKRQERLMAAGFDQSSYAQKSWKMTKDMNTEEVRTALADISSALRDKRSSVGGTRQWIRYNIDKIQAEHEDYTFLNEKNFFNFTQFMESWREKYKSKLYDSGDAFDAAMQVERLGLDAKKVLQKFDEFMAEIEEIEDMTKEQMEGMEDYQMTDDQTMRKQRQKNREAGEVSQIWKGKRTRKSGKASTAGKKKNRKK